MNKGIIGIAIVFVVLSAGAFAFTGMNRGFAMDEEKLAEIQTIRETVEYAIESGDYSAWLEAVEGTPMERMIEKVTEENFPDFVEMHNHMIKAKEIGKEFGFERGIKGQGFGRREKGNCPFVDNE